MKSNTFVIFVRKSSSSSLSLSLFLISSRQFSRSRQYGKAGVSFEIACTFSFPIVGKPKVMSVEFALDFVLIFQITLQTPGRTTLESSFCCLISQNKYHCFATLGGFASAASERFRSQVVSKNSKDNVGW